MKKIVAFVLLFLSLTTLATARQNNNELKLGVLPFLAPRSIVKLYLPLASRLTKELGQNVRVVTAGNFERFLQKVYAREYDIIILGSGYYFKAHDRAGYQAIARGYPPFRAGIIVLKSSEIETLEQMRGKNLAAVNRMTRGAYKLQRKALMEKGIDTDQDLDVHFCGDVDGVVYAVLNRQDDAGAIRMDSMERPALAKIKERFRTIYLSKENPQHAIAVRQDMDPAMVEKIRHVLISISLNNPETADILQTLQIKGIESLNNKDMEVLRKARQAEKKKRGEKL